jgi:NAD(P)-dependent dehydrogenase (short-subunit alcohol dehydrogenase family)
VTTVVITGSTQGIGRGLAAEFCHRGHSVVVSSRNAQRVSDTVAALSKSGGKVTGLACDVAEAQQVQALWDHATGQFGSVDIWINNAGLARTLWPIMELPQGEVETMVRTNMLGTINGCRVAVAGMTAQGSGKLFNVLGGGSDGEYFPGLGVYGTTKRGLDYFTNALVKELKDSPLIVAKIRPGIVITEAVLREIRDHRDKFDQSRKTMNRLADRVETVSPFLVDRILATDRSGSKIRWLTGGKIAGRMTLGLVRERPDQFKDFGI